MADSIPIAAALLLAASLTAALGVAGVYLRFAAVLFAALALAALARTWVPELAPAVALIILPLGGMALGLYGVAKFGRSLPALPATLLLAASLVGGLGALLGAPVIMAVAPLALGALLTVFASLHRMALIAALAGVLLLACACAFMAGGIGAAPLSLLAAAVFGLGLQRVRSRSLAVIPLASVLP